MNKSLFQHILGWVLILAHCAIFALIVYCNLKAGYDFSKLTTTLALIVPMFAGYTSVIVKFIIQNAQQPSNGQVAVSWSMVMLSFFFAVIFVTAIIVVVLLRTWNVAFGDFDQFKWILGAIETAFAIYLSQIISSVYGSEVAAPAGVPIAPRDPDPGAEPVPPSRR